MTVPDMVLINYIAPDGTTTDITRSVLYEDSYFELQAAAVPGSFHVTVKDPGHTHTFVAGGRIELTVSATRMFGGFITQPVRGFFFSADDTSKPVKSRRWMLDGVDYNHLFDKRVLRNPSDYTHKVPDVPVGANDTDKHLISLFSSYFDLGFSGSGTIDVSTMVTLVNTFTHKWVWPDQGSTMRAVLDAIVIQSTIYGSTAGIYWMDAYARVNWLAIQDTAAPWGFSDVPDGTNFIGWRDGSITEDGSSVINEVFVWGGAPIGSNGTVVMAHKFNSTSITDHGRWQLPENHPGEEGYKSQAELNARANALISGSTSGTSPVTGSQGLVNPDMQYNLTWFAHDVPLSGPNRLHLIPGDVTTFKLWSFSEDNGVTPYQQNLPLRQVRITFPTLPSDNPGGAELSFIQFDGTFGLQMSDPVWWWQYLRKMRPRPQSQPIVTTNNASGSFPYGSYFVDAPQESAGSGRVLFSIVPPYVPGSLEVWVNGLLKVKGTDYAETDPAAGTFTFTVAPAGGAVITCKCRTA